MEDAIIKKEFVRRILKEEAYRLERNQGLQMRKLLHFHTGTLESERDFHIHQEAGLDGKLTFKHKAYERFLDLKKKPQLKRGRRIKRKNYPIHNKFVFGHYYVIANRLMVDFTNDVAASLKREMER
ncbi:hypothetical protein [Cyclobacterium salsum]|uniref:hypothetical protein n=1 Tax=Cyclobacterium salsum TaxID=2666329 RepID=UPI001390EEEF|nr:hypothetical protein [Cyclobacterium salsum]